MFGNALFGPWPERCNHDNRLLELEEGVLLICVLELNRHKLLRFQLDFCVQNAKKSHGGVERNFVAHFVVAVDFLKQQRKLQNVAAPWPQFQISLDCQSEVAVGFFYIQVFVPSKDVVWIFLPQHAELHFVDIKFRIAHRIARLAHFLGGRH